MARLLNIETQAGSPIRWGGRTLIPFSQTVRLQAPGAKGGFIWNRPASLLVQSADGQEQVLQVPDLTRRIIWSLGAASLAAVIILWIINHKSLEKTND
jgi:hypothetical protein